MATALLLFETGTIFLVICGMVLVATDAVGWIGLIAKALIMSLGCVAALYYHDLYNLRHVRNFHAFLTRMPRLILAAVPVGIVFSYALFPEGRVPMSLALFTLLLSVAAVVLVRAVSYRLMQSPPFVERVLIVGNTPLVAALTAELESRPTCRVVGIVGSARNGDVARLQPPLLGPKEQLSRIVAHAQPDRIIVALAERRGRLPVQALLQARIARIPVEDGLDAYERLTGKLAIESLTPSQLIFSQGFRDSSVEAALARGVSLLASVVGLALFGPLMVLIALAIKLDSAGPVFFVQDRVGLGGRRFPLMKFRTMHPATSVTSEWVKDNGDRITRVGRRLRKYRLDELPQFINVLRGDMNLVGPRPHPLSNYQLFLEHIPFYAFRSTVRPGMTGWAQVRYGYANSLEEETEKMCYDLYYIKHSSVWLDLQILLQTLKVVIRGHEARVEGCGSTPAVLRRSDAA